MNDVFAGAALPLTQRGLDDMCTMLGITPATLWAVLAVETSGCGFGPGRRPVILFERHYFSHLTQGRYDLSNPDLSNPLAGGYGAAGDFQYQRLKAAVQLERGAALMSTSWGIGQVLGVNFAAAGCASIDDMVQKMCASEADQLNCMGAFLRYGQLHHALQARNWVAFARGYNGADYASNSYDIKLANHYQRYISEPLPSLDVRAAQLYLSYLGYRPGQVDGYFGIQTRTALIAFQSANGLPPSGGLDNATLVKLAGDPFP
jgi:hypothetical protein